MRPRGAGGAGVAGYQSNGTYAGYFSGDVEIFGSVSAVSSNAGVKSFLIDHPLDPENRQLRHACVESFERKNVYDGVAVADASGEIEVQMPAYLEALNEDFRYQLTPVGGPAPNLHIKQELYQGRFVVAGAAPGQKICWLLSGNRKDALARANPLVVEEDKPGNERGFYLHPEAFGQPKEKGVDGQRRPSPPPLSPQIP